MCLLLCNCQSESWGTFTDHPQDSHMGLSDHTGDSDNSNSFKHHFDIILTLQMVEIQIFWEGILTVKVHCRMSILTEKHFLSEFVGSTWELHMIHIGRCITQYSVIVCNGYQNGVRILRVGIFQIRIPRVACLPPPCTTTTCALALSSVIMYQVWYVLGNYMLLSVADS